MNLFRKIKTIVSLKKKVRFLLVEAVVMLGFSHFALHFFSFKRINGYLGTLALESDNQPSVHDRLLKSIAEVIELTSKNVPWNPKCYAQALAAKWMLQRRNIDSTIYFGVKKGEEGAMGHAWLRSGSLIITGKKGHRSFNVLAIYT